MSTLADIHGTGHGGTGLIFISTSTDYTASIPHYPRLSACVSENWWCPGKKRAWHSTVTVSWLMLQLITYGTMVMIATPVNLMNTLETVTESKQEDKVHTSVKDRQLSLAH